MLNDPANKDPAKLGNVAANLFDSMDKAHVDVEKVNKHVMSITLNVEVDSPAAVSMILDNMDGASDPDAELDDSALDDALNLANAVAKFAGEMEPDALAKAGDKIMSASAKFTSGLKGDPVKAAENLAKAMEAEAQLSQGMASNMIQGEPPSPVVTSDGVNKMSCIDPKNKNTALDGFKLPESLGEGIGDGQCMGAEVGSFILPLSNKISKEKFFTSLLILFPLNVFDELVKSRDKSLPKMAYMISDFSDF